VGDVDALPTKEVRDEQPGRRCRAGGEAVGPRGWLSAAAVGSALPAAEVEILDSIGVRAGSPEEAEQQATAAVERFATFLASALKIGEAAEMLGVSRRRVRGKLAEGQLYGIDGPGESLPGGRDRIVLPRFQFDAGLTPPGLAEVIASLPRTIHPLAVEGFFLSASPDLELEATAESASGRPLSPRAWLLAGYEPDAVAALAAAL
jgi:hypothetical protein